MHTINLKREKLRSSSKTKKTHRNVQLDKLMFYQHVDIQIKSSKRT